MAGILAQHVLGAGIGNANWRTAAVGGGEGLVRRVWSRLSLFPINVEEKQHKRALMMLRALSLSLFLPQRGRGHCVSFGNRKLIGTLTILFCNCKINKFCGYQRRSRTD